MSIPQIPKGQGKKRCVYCKGLFDLPARKRGYEARFCCPDHRKMYHKLGALPFSKLQDQIKKEFAKKSSGFYLSIDQDLFASEMRVALDEFRTLVDRLSSRIDQDAKYAVDLTERVSMLERDVIVLKIKP